MRARPEVAISAVSGLVVLAIVLVGAVGGFTLWTAGLQPLAIAVTGEAAGAFDSGLLQTAFDGRTRLG